MAYIGKIPATQGKDAGPALKLDDISGDFDGLTKTFSLSVDGTSVDPHVNNISVYLSGVYQIPGNSYSLSGSYIVFTGAPSASLDFHGSIVGDSRLMTPDNDTIETAAFTAGTRAAISGSFRTELSGSHVKLVGGGVSGSSTSLGSFGNVVSATHITASGNISASGTVFADTFQSTGGSVDGISFTDDLNLSGNFTASGDISGSGNIFGSGNLDIDGTSNLQGNVTLQNDLTVVDINASGNITGSVVSASSAKFTSVDIDGGTITATFDGALSSSAQIAADISGSRDAASISGSFGNQRVGTTDDVKFANITGSGNVSASGNLSITGNVDVDGTSNFAGNVTMQNDLTVTGRIDAEEIHTTFISSSIAQATGSNIFGDSISDSHQFTGSIDISGSGTVLKVSDGDVVMNDALTIGGNLTIPDSILHTGDTNTMLQFGTDEVKLRTGGSSRLIARDANVELYVPLISDSNISSSFTSTGSFGSLAVGTNSGSTLVTNRTGNVGIGAINPSNPLYVKHATSGSIVIHSNADTTGTRSGIYFKSVNTTETNNSQRHKGAILFEGDGTGAGPGLLHFIVDTAHDSGGIDAGTSPTMTISGSNVGIGTTAPVGELHIKSAASTHNDLIIDVTTDDYASGLYYYEAGSAKSGIIHYGDSSNGVEGGLQFLTGGVSAASHTRMVIDSSGNVGIGTTSPDYILETVSSDGNLARFKSSGNQNTSLIIDANSNYNANITFQENESTKFYWGTDASTDSLRAYSNYTSAVVFSISGSGNVGIGTSAPDSTLHVSASSTGGGDTDLMITNTDTTAQYHRGLTILHPNISNTHTALIMFGNAQSSGNSGHMSFVNNASDGSESIRWGIYAKDDLMTLTGAGNVGIGTTSPTGHLEIYNSDNTTYDVSQTDSQRDEGTSLVLYNPSTTTNSFSQLVFRNRNSGTGAIRIAAISKGADNSDLAISTDETDMIYIDSSANNVGIGTTSPGAKLHVSASTNTTIGKFERGYAGDAGAYIVDIRGAGGETENAALYVNQSGTAPIAAFLGTGAVGIGTITPNKTNNGLHIESLASGHDAGITLRRGTATGNTTTGTIRYGGAGGEGLTLSNTSTSGVIRFQVSASDGALSTVMTISGSSTGTTGVGIGSSTPVSQLDVAASNGSGPVGLTITNTNQPSGGETNQSASIDFRLTHPTNTYISAGEIIVGKEDDWNPGSGQADSFMTFHTTNAGVSHERMRIKSGGNVGIGSASPSVALDLVTATDGNWAVKIKNTDADNGYGLYVAAGDDASVRAFTVADKDDNDLFGITGAGRVGIGTMAPLEKLHVASGSVLVTGAGEGYSFEAGAAANTLDDYEEGTFTPTVQFGGSTETAGGAVGWYTKIGALVTVQIRWYADGSVDNTGTLTCSLPFTVANITNGYTSGMMWGNLIDFADAPSIESDPNTAVFTFNRMQASTSSTISSVTHSNCGSGFQFRCTYTYRTT